MTDLERLFRRLVRNLADTEPARLHQPLPLADVYQSIVPYRSNRRSLGLESSEDYELVLLRLAGGEGGLVRTEPEEARKKLAAEAASSNPDLGLLRRMDNVFLTLRSEPLAYALGPEPHATESRAAGRAAAPAPPDFAEPDELPAVEAAAPEAADPVVADPVAAVPVAAVPVAAVPDCLYCGGSLPRHRTVTFCPHCGQRQGPATCPACHSEVEPGWRHCVNCGSALHDG
ncbi:MAG TPA: zinc ribbon domain-containing protein [Gemmatimonadales bacterium]|nr:zinc ribbon domain-containing protein [Gemmatimonadales bacterium]